MEFDLVAEDRYTDIVSAGIVGFRFGLSPEGAARGQVLYHAHRPDMPRRVHRLIEHAAVRIKRQASSFRFDEKQLSALHLGYLKSS